MTMTGSLANTTDVVEKTVIVDMAESGANMTATHTCMKTYFIKNRTWTEASAGMTDRDLACPQFRRN
jgi:hypothetical protein